MRRDSVCLDITIGYMCFTVLRFYVSMMKDLKSFFAEAGEVAFADCHKLRQGEGIVEFQNEDDMRNALRKLDSQDLGGRRIHLREVSSAI